MEEVKNLVRFVTIPNFPNYCIGEDGRVWSDNRKRYLKWYRGKGCERPHVTLFHNGNSAKLFIATLVAQAFVTNPKPNVYKYVRYKDGNSANNHYAILNGVETKLEVSMENEIKSVSDIISEISKKDKKRQVFILTNLINQLKSTRTEANSNYEDCRLSYTRRTDNYIGNFKLMLFKKQLDCLDMIIENLDSYLDELLSK